VYSYSGCGTCRKALNWLNSRGIKARILPIREEPPKEQDLKRAIKQLGTIRSVFNTSGTDYKAMALKERIGTMTEDDAIKLLSTNGNLVKRPFILCPDGTIIIGFDEEILEKQLG
jgi:arsenate reductase